MRLIELDIHNVRGICDLDLKPKGNNFVIWGGNGSGKSAVVDAIDFLLTGRISRLTGKGTGDIRLEVHGTHVDHKAEDASVRAVVAIPHYEKPIEVKRCIATPGNLEYAEPKDKPHFAPILSVAARGQHVLTRREILKFITAEPSDRAQGIQAILDIREIEEIRKVLVKAENTCEQSLNQAKVALTTAEGEINIIVGLKAFDTASVLKFINERRKLLGALPILGLNSAKIKMDLTPPVSLPADKIINTIQLQLDIKALTEFQTENILKPLFGADVELLSQIKLIKANPHLLRSLKRLELIQLGIQLVDDSGVCPLCDTSWPAGQLRDHLNQHLKEARTAIHHQNSINTLAHTLLESISHTLSRIKNVLAAAETVGLNDDKVKLQSWASDLQNIIGKLANPIEKYEDTDSGAAKFRKSMTMPDSAPLFNRIISSVESKYPKTTPELDAWDTLTKLETRTRSYEEARILSIQKLLIYKRSFQLNQSFIKARDAVLQSLYDSVRDRFVELYRYIHGSDEAKFSAQIKPDEAGIDFTVDFYGRGEHPPHALHSEGHQVHVPEQTGHHSGRNRPPYRSKSATPCRCQGKMSV